MDLSDERLQALADGADEHSAALAAEVLRLRRGIRVHMSKTGHEVCWLNDLALWRLVDAAPQYPHETLPEREEFLAQCARFYESRLTGTPYEEPKPSRTVGQQKRSGGSA